MQTSLFYQETPRRIIIKHLSSSDLAQTRRGIDSGISYIVRSVPQGKIVRARLTAIRERPKAGEQKDAFGVKEKPSPTVGEVHRFLSEFANKVSFGVPAKVPPYQVQWPYRAPAELVHRSVTFFRHSRTRTRARMHAIFPDTILANLPASRRIKQNTYNFRQATPRCGPLGVEMGDHFRRPGTTSRSATGTRTRPARFATL